MKRKLTKEETIATNDALNHLTERLDILNFYKRYYTLMLDDGLKLQFLEKEHEFKQKLHETKREEEESKIIINNLKEQLKGGVEVKDGSTIKK